MTNPEQRQPLPPPKHRKPRARVATSLKIKLRAAKVQEKALQDITRKILTTTEAIRGTISHQLHDEIAQTLLGIQVRLLALQQEAITNEKGFAQGLITTQRLLTESVQTINRFADELAISDEN